MATKPVKYERGEYAELRSVNAKSLRKKVMKLICGGTGNGLAEKTIIDRRKALKARTVSED